MKKGFILSVVGMPCFYRVNGVCHEDQDVRRVLRAAERVATDFSQDQLQ